ncbi:MAG: Site-specific recombinase, phage integrase family [uncultured bacterium]|nr:MAG: Site-specific recombinase, phage integrase family [uncultured bacterium]
MGHNMISLKDAHQQFIGHLKGRGRASATILAYGKDIEQLVSHLQSLGKEDANAVETTDLQIFMDKLSKEAYTAKSISRKTNSTKTFFKFLKSSGIIEDDPARGLEHPKFENKPPRILSELEYRALRDVARSDLRMFAIIELFLQTGIRIGELAKITVDDVTLEGPTSVLHIKQAEGAVERTIPLNKPAVEALKRYLEVRPQTQNKTLFVTKTGKPLLIRNIRTAIDRYFRLAGISGAKVNDLRHTWIAHHLKSGTSLLLISKLAGHKRVSTTERYLQFITGVTNEGKVQLEEL